MEIIMAEDGFAIENKEQVRMFCEKKDCELLFKYLTTMKIKEFYLLLEVNRLTTDFINFMVENVKALSENVTLSTLELHLESKDDLINCGIESYQSLDALSVFETLLFDLQHIPQLAQQLKPRMMKFPLKKVHIRVNASEVFFALLVLTREWTSHITVHFKDVKFLKNIVSVCFAPLKSNFSLVIDAPENNALREHFKPVLKYRKSLILVEGYTEWMPITSKEVQYLKSQGYFRY